jgi:pyruvate/2-oxoglutarate dehydrogenase complex dihydrolipoamide acyltransferase (E2) component
MKSAPYPASVPDREKSVFGDRLVSEQMAGPASLRASILRVLRSRDGFSMALSPAARRLVAEQNVDIQHLKGTGPGTISIAEIEADSSMGGGTTAPAPISCRNASASDRPRPQDTTPIDHGGLVRVYRQMSADDGRARVDCAQTHIIRAVTWAGAGQATHRRHTSPVSDGRGAPLIL